MSVLISNFVRSSSSIISELIPLSDCSNDFLAQFKTNNSDSKVKFNNLTLLLHDDHSRKVFKSFLTKEHSSENLEFWLAVDRYRTEDLHRAKMIYNRFLAPGALYEVCKTFLSFVLQ